MPEWRIYYADGRTVRGHTRTEWDAAPIDGVQVVVLMVPPPFDNRRWTGVVDRQLWTGEDEYTLNAWSVKRGAWMERAAYDAVWERACGDP